MSSSSRCIHCRFALRPSALSRYLWLAHPEPALISPDHACLAGGIESTHPRSAHDCAQRSAIFMARHAPTSRASGFIVNCQSTAIFADVMAKPSLQICPLTARGDLPALAPGATLTAANAYSSTARTTNAARRRPRGARQLAVPTIIIARPSMAPAKTAGTRSIAPGA